MIHIHYKNGPEVLADISMETYNNVVLQLQQGQLDSIICMDCKITQGALNTIRQVVNSGQRRCCFCGKLFDPKGHSRAISCGDIHYLPCIDCGSPLQVKESYSEYMRAGGRRCPICRGNQIGSTRRNKPEEEKQAILNKQETTMMQRYGARNALQVPEIKAKVDATVKERYGVDNLSQSEEIQIRIKENSLKRFGVSHYSNDPEIRQRMIDGMITKYGVKNAQQNVDIQKKTRETNLARYGVENVFQSPQVRQVAMNNHIAKYGVPWPNQRIEHVTDPSKYSSYLEFLNDPRKFVLAHYTLHPTAVQLATDIGLDDATLCSSRLKLLAIDDLIAHNFSSSENSLVEFIRQIDPSVVIKLHDRDVLNGFEIDVLLPDLHVGFECNPTCTHNSSFTDPWGSPPKDYMYHANKSKLAAQKGIFLYHIFGYEWIHRREVILSQIRNLIGANENKVYGRQLDVIDVPYLDSIQFLNTNHRQGSAQSSVRLGLVDLSTKKLVSLMTFGKMRSGIGKKSTNSENDWELIRFCNCLNTSVVGGASKLFKYFVRNYAPAKVVSFSDVAHTRGNLYQTLGFTQVSLSSPGYVWVNLVSDNYYNRVSCQKSNLLKLFDDVTESDVSVKTEPQIMTEHGYAQVFDSGVIRWECTF